MEFSAPSVSAARLPVIRSPALRRPKLGQALPEGLGRRAPFLLPNTVAERVEAQGDHLSHIRRAPAKRGAACKVDVALATADRHRATVGDNQNDIRGRCSRQGSRIVQKLISLHP